MRPEDNSVEPTLRFHLYVGSRDGTVVIRLVHQALFPLSHLTGGTCTETGLENRLGGKQRGLPNQAAVKSYSKMLYDGKDVGKSNSGELL